MGSSKNHVEVNVWISQNADNRSYAWQYDSDYTGFDPKSGNVTLQDHGETTIRYVLQETAYELVYVNLDPDSVATRQIRDVTIDGDTNSITIRDHNIKGHTNKTPFGLRLIARPKGDIHTVIVSPDPEVINDPNSKGV